MSKITQILLYVTMGISILVVGFFYFGDNLIDYEAYEAKIAKMESPEQVTSGSFDFQSDMTETDEVTEEGDTATVAESDTLATEEAAPVVEEDEPEAVEEEAVKLTFMENLVYKRTDIALGWGYILVLITAIIAIIFPLVYIFTNPAGLVKALIVLVAVAVLVGVAYMLGSDKPIFIPGYEGTDNSDPVVLRYVDTGLITTYFILGLAVLSILYSQIAKYFK